MDDTVAERRYRTYCESEIGTIEIVCTDRGITSLAFIEPAERKDDNHPILKDAVKQVEEYLQGTRQEFSLLLSPEGTEFERLVWKHLLAIPCGETRSYGEIAVAIGNMKSVRAVGRANGRNTIAIIVPCHRVIGSDGSLTGYAGGIHRKQWLLNHEMRMAGRILPF